MERKIFVTENNRIGTSYMYPNDPKYNASKLTNNNQIKNMEFVCSVSEIQTEYSVLLIMLYIFFQFGKVGFNPYQFQK